MRSGCDTTTPCAPEHDIQQLCDPRSVCCLCASRRDASLAQLAEHALRKRMVVGSIPTGGFVGSLVVSESNSCVVNVDTLGIEPRASRMLSGCDTTTPCALLKAFRICVFVFV